MYLLRRAAVRTASSSSFGARNLSIRSAASPFRISAQKSKIAPFTFRRFNSDEAKSVEEAEEVDAVEAADAAETFSAGDSYRTVRDGFPSARRAIDPSSSIYVGNLQFSLTAEDLKHEFGKYGEIVKATLASDSRGLSKGFGYVTFKDTESATAAIKGHDSTVFEGRRVIVNYQLSSPRTRNTNPPSKTLFIGNLAFEMSDADLNKLFRDIRNVIDVRVAIDRRTGQPRGFAHADFTDTESAEKALAQLAGKECYGRPLRIDFSANKVPRLGGSSSESSESS